MFSLALPLLLIACDSNDEGTFPTTPTNTPPGDGQDLTPRSGDDGGDAEEADGSMSVVAGITDGRQAPTPPATSTCGEDDDSGIAAWGAPETYGVQFKRLTLLGDEGTADHDLFTVEALRDASELTLSAEMSPLPQEMVRPPAGTYTGVVLEVFSTRADIDLGLADAALESLPVRGWFVDNGDIAPRDITVEIDGLEHWVTTGDFDMIPAITEADLEAGLEGELGLEGDEPPADRLTLWADEEFWGADPIALSSADGGKDYRLSIAGGSATVTDGTDLSIALAFDINAVLSWWEGGAVDGSFSLGTDCGLRVGPPDISIEITQN
ncbi:MAG: hypothetical protein P8R54_06645 [Myxococcota bacterium]|nr:hypothetical protein [Myxococcota bacterium]